MRTGRATVAGLVLIAASDANVSLAQDNSVMVRVRVVSASTGQPVPAATLRLRTIPDAVVVTDSQGLAAFVGVPRRMEGVEATHPEFEARTEILLLGGTFDQVSLTMPLRPRGATALDTVSVTAYAPSNAPGLEARRLSGRGHIIDRREINRVKPRATTDMLRRVAGLRVDAAGARTRIRSRRAADCEMLLYLDGAPVFNELTPAVTRGTRTSRQTAVPSTIDRIPPDMLEAIEVYLGPSQTPPQYSRGGANCGAILIWTRSSDR